MLVHRMESGLYRDKKRVRPLVTFVRGVPSGGVLTVPRIWGLPRAQKNSTPDGVLQALHFWFSLAYRYEGNRDS